MRESAALAFAAGVFAAIDAVALSLIFAAIALAVAAGALVLSLQASNSVEKLAKEQRQRLAKLAKNVGGPEITTE